MTKEQEILKNGFVQFIAVYVSASYIQAMLDVLKPYLKSLNGYDHFMVHQVSKSDGKRGYTYQIQSSDIGDNRIAVLGHGETPLKAFKNAFPTLVGRKLSSIGIEVKS